MELDPRLRGDNATENTSREADGRSNSLSPSNSDSDSLPPAPSDLNDVLAAGYSSTYRSADGSVDADSSTGGNKNNLKGGSRGGTGFSQDLPPSSSSYNHRPDERQNDDDTKRSRACEACRGLKVRCEPDPDDGPCKRCKKSGRSCIVTQPTRKRQKKTDSRVAELEKKIDALTASLHARAGGSGGRESHSQATAAAAAASAASPAKRVAESASPADGIDKYERPWTWTPTSSTSQKPGFGNSTPAAAANHPPRAGNPLVARPPTRSVPQTVPTTTLAGQKRKVSQRMDGGGGGGGGGGGDEDQRSPARSTISSSVFVQYDGDIIERGIISMERATKLFDRYNNRMCVHLPAVVFPARCTANELRRTKPVLFLAVMAAAASEDHGLSRVLQRDLLQAFAEKVIMTGEKSLEIVQALQVAVIWYWPPDHFEELKFYQLIHIAAVMAIDIGLDKKLIPTKLGGVGGGGMAMRDSPMKPKAMVDATSIEARRAWLSCHFLTTNASMSLHRPQLIAWTDFLSESLHLLETSPEAGPLDRYLCQLVRTHRVAHEIGEQFAMADPASTLDITDIRTQFTVRAFERQLDKIMATIDPKTAPPTLIIAHNLVNLYLHEIALLDAAPEPARRPASMAESPRAPAKVQEPLLPAHISAITTCLYSIDNVLSSFLSLEVSSIRCLPVFNFVRVAYTVVILLKIYFAASGPDSELGKVLNKDTMRVEYFLEALLEKFRVTAAEDKSRPAAKFLVVLAMLRTWFLKQGKQESRQLAAGKRKSAAAAAAAAAAATSDGGGPSPQHTVSAGGTPRQSHSVPPHNQHPHQAHTQFQFLHHHQQQQQQGQQHQQHQPASNLHLLSEVATGTSDSKANSPHSLFHHSVPGGRHFSQSQPQPQPVFSESPTSVDHAMSMPPPNVPISTPSNNNNNNSNGNNNDAGDPSSGPGMIPSSSSPFGTQQTTPWGTTDPAAAAAAMNPGLYGMMNSGAGQATAPPSNSLFGAYEIDASLLSGVPDGYEGNAGIVMQEPWFSDMFQGVDPNNMFSFQAFSWI